MLNVAIQSSYRLAQLQSTLLTKHCSDVYADAEVQCELMQPQVEIPALPETVKKRVTIRSPRKASMRPSAPRTHKPTQRPRVRNTSDDIELHSDEEVMPGSLSSSATSKTVTTARQYHPAPTLMEEVERIVQHYGVKNTSEKPPISVPQASAESTSSKTCYVESV